MAIESGTRFGSYEIGDPIGAGGMGEVYRAHDTTLERDVAIKVLPASFADDAGRVERFEREAKTLASLNHPNIAHIYGLERSDGTTALVMELVEGPTLEDRIAGGPVPADQALGIAMQIADALEAAHSQNIVHRDLKPANIKLRSDGTVKVLDFGIAKALAPENLTSGPQSPIMTTPATQVGVILGTAAYMSPEQAKGKAVDQRTDIWAFGCVLYEMLTGQLAFGAEDMPTTLARVIANDANLDTLPSAVAPAVRRTIELCLQKDPRKRVADIRDVKLALEGAFETVSRSAEHEAAISRSRWSRALQVAAGGLIAGVAVGVFVWLVMRVGPPPVNRFAHALPDEQTLRRAGRAVLAVSPDGRQLAYNTSDGLYLRAMDVLDARLIRGTEEDLSNPFFSPDGQMLAYWSVTDNALKRIAVGGGAAAIIAEDVAANPVGTSWAADGTILYAQPQGIFRVPASGGAPATLVIARGEAEAVFAPQLLPDGETVLLSAEHVGNDRAWVVAHSLATGEQTRLVEGSGGRYVNTGHLVYAVDDVLFAVAFDAETLTVLGAPVPLVQSVAQAARGTAQVSISENGTLAYLAGRGAGETRTLVWVDRNGREESIPMQPGSYGYLHLSPDGGRAVIDDYGSSNDLWVWDFTSQTRTRLTLGEAGGDTPVWTPDGQRIAYRPGSGNVIYSHAANNTGRPEPLVTVTGVDDARAYFFSPSGSELVIQGGGGGGGTDSDLALVTIGGEAEPQVLLRGPYSEENAELSPDGHWMAYESNESGENQILIVPFPNVDAGRIPVSNAGGEQPIWSSNGRELFYLEPGPPVRLMSASIEVVGGEISVGDRVPIIDDWPYVGLSGDFARYDVSADGRFLVLKRSAAERIGEQIIIVQNWFEELKRLVPTE